MDEVSQVALEWLKQQDLSDKTPVEAYQMYIDARNQIQLS